MKQYKNILFLLLVSSVFFSCKKTAEVPLAITKPRIGTAWTYQLDTYGAGGTTFTSNTVTYKATNEQTLGGATWFNITDSTTATIYLLKQKTGGLFNYANNTANVLCKEPAGVNDTYSGFFNGAVTNFTVKEINSTIGGSPFADYTVNKYEGVQAGVLKDIIWFNADAWIVRRETYALNMSGVNNIKFRCRLLKFLY